MKRHPAIQPLSRQHHTALLAVLLLKKGLARQADPALMSQFLQQVWQQELQPHFDAEEQFLLPLMQPRLPAVVCDILVHHAQLYGLYREIKTAATASNLQSFVELLEKHVRLEERQFFPAAEACLDETALAWLAQQLPEEKDAGCFRFSTPFWE